MIAFLGQPWWYWFLGWVAFACVIAVPVAAYLERREDQADREAWDALYGPRVQQLAEDLARERSLTFGEAAGIAERAGRSNPTVTDMRAHWRNR